jgi:hypothetical protein
MTVSRKWRKIGSRTIEILLYLNLKVRAATFQEISVLNNNNNAAWYQNPELYGVGSK